MLWAAVKLSRRTAISRFPKSGSMDDRYVMMVSFLVLILSFSLSLGCFSRR